MKKELLGKKVPGAGAVFLFFGAVLLFMAWCTLHDMQRSEGIGLYYSSVLGKADTFWTGAAAEAGGMALLLALLLFPCILFRRLKPDCFLRLLTAYLAFMPTVSLAYLVHLLNGTEKIKCSEALLAGNLGQAVREGITGAAPMLSAGIPLLLLTGFALKSEEEIPEGKKARRWIPAAAAGGILLVMAVIFPALREVCTFAVRYILLLYGFSLWERLLADRPQYKNWGWVIFGLLGLRGIYIMAEVMSVYHL